MTSPDLSDFLLSGDDWSLRPIVRSIPLDNISPFELYERARRGGARVLLESAKGGRYSYIGWGVESVYSSRGTISRIDDPDGTLRWQEEGNPWELLERRFDRTIAPHPQLQNFTGGAVGYLGYDMVRFIERLPELATDDIPIPDALFLFLDSFVEVDNLMGVVRLVVLLAPENESDLRARWHTGSSRLDDMERILAEPVDRVALHSTEMPHPEGADRHPVEPHANRTRNDFEQAVARARQYISDGDIFQANLSIRLDLPFVDEPTDLYARLRQVNPAPYMSLLELSDSAIVGASPELLLKVSGRSIETRPIAGTRPRGHTPGETLANARELIEDEKERAEHLMLVDLERNDIGRVARYGSVKVPEFMAIEEYSHVIHIVSHVVGELADRRTTFDAIKSMFPGGTITGAPKIRSMEVIEELEPTRRGIYTGSTGWIGYNGDTELNIVIRTILLHNGRAYIQAGAGIVADSVPKREYRESLRKAAAAVEAVRLATTDHTSSSNSAAHTIPEGEL